MLKLLGPKKKAEPELLLTDGTEHQQRVAEAAYYLAEQRGFEPGGELDDWFRAENMIDAGAEAGAKG